MLTDVAEETVTAIVDVAAAASGSADEEANLGKATVGSTTGKPRPAAIANRSVSSSVTSVGKGGESTVESVASAIVSLPGPASAQVSSASSVLPVLKAANKSPSKRKNTGLKFSPDDKTAGATAALLAATQYLVAGEVVTPSCDVLPEPTPGPATGRGKNRRQRPATVGKKKSQKSGGGKTPPRVSGESKRKPPQFFNSLPTVKKPTWADLVDKGVWQQSLAASSSPPPPRSGRGKSPRRCEPAADFVPDKFDTIKQRRRGGAAAHKNTSPRRWPSQADVQIRECCVKIYRDPQLLAYAPLWFSCGSSSRIKKTILVPRRPKKNRIKEAFILSDRISGSSSPAASVASPLPPSGPDLMVARERRPSVCSGVDPQQPLFAQIAAMPRTCRLDFDSLVLSDDFSQLISSPQFESLVQSFVMLKQRTLEVRTRKFIIEKLNFINRRYRLSLYWFQFKTYVANPKCR
jgi:hypothetical protein